MFQACKKIDMNIKHYESLGICLGIWLIRSSNTKLNLGDLERLSWDFATRLAGSTVSESRIPFVYSSPWRNQVEGVRGLEVM